MAPSPDTLTVADRTLLAALRGWSGEADDRTWSRFAPAWRETLRQGWAEEAAADRESARERVRGDHRAQARPDLSRVHPSWWLRALQEESPAVQRAVAAGAPKGVQDVLRERLGLDVDDLRTDRPPLAEALQATLALWTERLVGDRPDRDDPPVIAALTRPDLKQVSRLVHLLGLAKWAASGLDRPELGERDLARFTHLRRRLATADDALRRQALADVGKFGQARRQDDAGLGLLTLARLLGAAEPYRVRWALQHVPYSLARYVRTLMGPKVRHDPALIPWEGEVLAAACDRLRDEGQLEPGPGGAP